jgi:hypothetical protein
MVVHTIIHPNRTGLVKSTYLLVMYHLLSTRDGLCNHVHVNSFHLTFYIVALLAVWHHGERRTPSISNDKRK